MDEKPKVKILSGSSTYMGVRPEYSDEDIREFARTVWGWDEVRLVRQPHIVQVWPPESAVKK